MKSSSEIYYSIFRNPIKPKRTEPKPEPIRASDYCSKEQAKEIATAHLQRGIPTSHTTGNDAPCWRSKDSGDGYYCDFDEMEDGSGWNVTVYSKIGFSRKLKLKR